ncbi:hypothetical protein B0A48_17352 [Cryoendolithus antarcticus]|uniref:Uncharacterized protein n=1 Tax=Cryoendolithus antarcticus TaxID=1507870 RepID=A0A1V8SCB4_9PEZI|nr:hypothetical protein B0A48_17352 [Cryoendolithus antarcticus]
MAAKQLASSTLGSPSDTYFFTLAQAGQHFATIGSDDSLRLFDLPTVQPINEVKGAHTGLACLTASADGTTFVTAGRDGRVRIWDPRTATKSPNLELAEPKSAGISAVACAGNYVAAGTESTKEGLGDVSVLVYDTRSSAQPIRSYAESHTDTITQLAWHPTQSNLLLSGSTDGLVSIFDANVEEEEDALMQVLNPRSAVHCAGFLTDDQVYTLSTDEQFSVYGLDKTGTAEEEPLPAHQFGDLRDKLDCMYVVNLAQESSLPGPVLAFGHNVNQTLSLVPLQAPNWEMGIRVDLPGAHGEEVVRDVLLIDPSTALTCGEDGHVRSWALSPSGDGQNDSVVAPGSKKAKRNAKKGVDRSAPY